MGRAAGLSIKLLQFFFRLVEFGCAAVILGIFSYYLATLHNHSLPINDYIRSIEGISGVAVLYTGCAIILLWCLGGFAFFAFLAVLLDLAFIGGFIYVAYETRGGASSCTGIVNTPFGTGDVDTNNSVSDGSGGFTALPSLHTACRLQTAAFSVAIVAIIFFLISAVLEVAMWRHHKADKKYGPGPSNNYTTGSGSSRLRFWQRRRRNNTMASAYEKPVNANALPAHATPADVRTSYATDNTMVGAGPEPVVHNKYGHGGVNDGYLAPGTAAPGFQTSGVTGAHHSPAVNY
jgi:hypothetical protein